MVERPWRIHPRIARRRRRLAALLGFVVLLAAGWWFGPGLASRYAPFGALIWLSNSDIVLGDWASRVLQGRLAAVRVTPYSKRAYDLEEQFRTKCESATGHDWIGQYDHEMMWILGGRQLCLTPTEYLWHLPGGMQPGPMITGVVFGFDGSTVRLDTPIDRRVLRSARSLPFHQWMDSELTLIRWEDWRYLVAREELIDFCNDVNGGEPLCEFHLTRRPATKSRDERAHSRPTGDSRPELPSPFDRYILQSPITATVIDCSERPVPNYGVAKRRAEEAKRFGLMVRIFDVTLKPDRPTEVFVGMRFYAGDRFGLGHVEEMNEGVARMTYVELAPLAAARTFPATTSFSSLAPGPLPLTPQLDHVRSALMQMAGSVPNTESQPSTSRPADVAVLRRARSMEDHLLLQLARALRK